MGKIRQFLFVEGAAIASLALAAGALGAVEGFAAMTNPTAILSPSSAARGTFAYTFLLGALPALVFGAPAYWLMLQKGLARWYYALALGTAPAFLFLLADTNLAFWALVCGGMVALATHMLCRRLGPNNSFKGMPLRGTP